MSEQPVDELTALETKLVELTKAMADFQTRIQPLQHEQNNMKAAKEEVRQRFQEEMNALNARDRIIQEMIFDMSKDIREFNRQKESIERQIEQSKRAQLLANEFATLEARWDTLTMGAPWREWALDHQLSAGQKITYYRRMILADTMGLGKTLSVILSLDYIKAATTDASPEHPYGYSEVTNQWGYTTIDQGVSKQCGLKVLYFCPATMLRNVEREVKRWAPHRTVLVIGGLTKIQRKFLITAMLQHPEYVVICNYEAWRKDKSLIEDLIDVEFDTCIIDEAHNIKDRKSIAYRGIKQILDRSNIPFVVPMTGTPILNKPQELYSLLTLVDHETFWSETNFLSDYCWQNPDNQKWAFKPGGLDRLAKRISNRYLRRTKEEAGIKLPPRTIIEHMIEVDEDLYPEQARARKEMRKWGSIMLDPEKGTAITAAAMIAVYTRLRQIETWPAGIEIHTKDENGTIISTVKLDIEQSQKLDEIIHYDFDENEWVGLVPEIITDERVIVFSQFTKPLLELKRRLEKSGLRVAMMIGDTDENERNEILKDFDNAHTPNRADSKYDIVLCNYRVGGVGATMTAATQMIILDEEWNPGKRDQAYDRNYRIGQDKPTTIHILRDKDTIDEWLAAIIAQKEDMVEGFHASADELSRQVWEMLKKGES